MSPFGRTNQQQMPHHHLEGQPIEGPLGEARHSEELKLFPIALVQQVCSRLYHRCSCQLFRSVAYHRVCHFMAKNHLHEKFSWLRTIFKTFVTENFSSHRKLVVIFTEVEHSAEDKDVPAWKNKCVPDRL